MGTEELPRKWVLMDDRGRITIPPYMREALNINVSKGENHPVFLELYPDMENCKSLLIKRERP